MSGAPIFTLRPGPHKPEKQESLEKTNEDQMNKIEKIKASRKRKSEERLRLGQVRITVQKDEFNCGICKELLVEPITLPCAHNYCFSCIKAAVRVDEKCPVCSIKIDNLITLLKPNPLITSMLKTAKIPEYAKRVKEYNEIKEFNLLETDFKHTKLYNRIKVSIDNLLQRQHVINVKECISKANSMVGHENTNHKLGIKYLLSTHFIKYQACIIRDVLIYIDGAASIQTYVSENIDDLTAKEAVWLLNGSCAALDMQVNNESKHHREITQFVEYNQLELVRYFKEYQNSWNSNMLYGLNYDEFDEDEYIHSDSSDSGDNNEDVFMMGYVGSYVGGDGQPQVIRVRNAHP